MKVAIALLALVAFAQVAVAQSDATDSLLFDTWRADSTATVQQQRTLLQSSPASGNYSPRYSPSPSPSPIYIPAASPTPGAPGTPGTPGVPGTPGATGTPGTGAPGPKPKVCKFPKTLNVNYYSLTIRSTKNWGAGRDAIVKATAAVYRRYSQRPRVKVTGAGGQMPQKPYYDFTYLVEVPVTPCVGFKEGMRNALRNAVKRVKAKGQKALWFSIIA